jgi:hypothetical protein
LFDCCPQYGTRRTLSHPELRPDSCLEPRGIGPAGVRRGLSRIPATGRSAISCAPRPFRHISVGIFLGKTRIGGRMAGTCRSWRAGLFILGPDPRRAAYPAGQAKPKPPQYLPLVW